MNQYKLRSLMFHAGFCNEDGGWDNRPIWEQDYDNFQRFAELIVEECANVADENYIHRGSRTCGLAIRLHFGVKE